MFLVKLKTQRVDFTNFIFSPTQPISLPDLLRDEKILVKSTLRVFLMPTLSLSDTQTV
jgi:hypothetical protein